MSAINNPLEKAIAPTSNQTIFKTLNQSEILEVTIAVAIDSLIINKNKEIYYPATLKYTDDNGEMMNRNIKVKPRGRSRRKVCDFPPLKIKFCQKELASQGIREVHKSLKLVTHCMEGEAALKNVLEEYYAYKIYNKLTNNSLKVQLVKVNYEDTNSNSASLKYGILIEDIDELAERLEGQEIEGFGKKIKEFDEEILNIFAMFQYMIGNEDWRLEFQRNVKFIESSKLEKLIPIPYDFDASGLVNASYAKSDRDLRLKSVKQRAFMGYFKHKSDREETVILFNEKKDAIYQLIEESANLDEMHKKMVTSYFDSFYEIINNPKLLKMAMPLKGKLGVPTNEMGGFN